jgi:hypothetical protein
MKAHFGREKSFSEKTSDYAEVMEDANFLKDASVTLQQIIVNSDNGPELMYELAKNKAEYARINAMSPIAAAREIGRIEASLTKPSEEKKTEQKKITKAPQPIAPVGSKSSTVSKRPEEMSQREYEAKRREEMKASAPSW